MEGATDRDDYGPEREGRDPAQGRSPERTQSADQAPPRVEPAPGTGIEAVVTGSRDGHGARWQQIQGSFVDEPRQALEEADRLVREVLDEVARAAAREREQLSRSWSGSDDTEAMRLSLRRYRQLFEFALR
ncbi:MAG: hypothetical protein J2P45_30415 [Candidatus Dormibacteraeota bacterium]|nr:hypothetical protein [Candidatus Dormibacteraeota bacterium]